MKARGKTFLSESHDEGGSVSWSVNTQAEIWHEARVEASVYLRDCDKQICLDFDCNEFKHIDKRLAKLDTLMVELNKMREALLLAKEELKPNKFYY